MDELRTDRLLLRRWRDADRAPFAALNADPVVMEHFPAPLTREQSDALADRLDASFDRHGYGAWAVEVLGEDGGPGPFAGFTGRAWSEVLGRPALEVGWRLAQPFWGRGIASEAARAALEVGLRAEPEVVSFTAVANVRSQRVMERVGMTYAGTFAHPRLPEGHPLRPHVLYRRERQR